MTRKLAFLIAVLAGLSCGGSGKATSGGAVPEASKLAGAVLNMVRIEQRAMVSGVALSGAEARVDSLFLVAIKLDPSCVRQAVTGGGGECAGRLVEFLTEESGLEQIQSRNDPAALILGMLRKEPNRVQKNPELLEGYAAAYQMCMEIERDGTVLQDLMPFVVQGLGCPMSFRDLGLAEGGITEIEEMGKEASAAVGHSPYGTTPEDFVMPLVKLDSWGGKFSGELTADSLAARVEAEPWFEALKPHLRQMSQLRLVFFGDSHMDKIHWSTVAPFPEIIRALFARINPQVTVLNAGRGGDDSGEALARLSPEIVGQAPQVAFVMFGGNDSRHYERSTPAVSPEQYVKNIGEIVSRFKATGGSVVLMEPPHSPGEMTGADKATFDAICDSLRLLPPRLETGWIEVGGTLAKELSGSVFARDMIHMCPTGHLLVTKLILQHLAAGNEY